MGHQKMTAASPQASLEFTGEVLIYFAKGYSKSPPTKSEHTQSALIS